MCAFHITGVGGVKGRTPWNTSIKGFKIVSSNTRYCLHIEQNGDSEVNIENCIFEWGGRPKAPDNPHGPVLGCGGSYFQNVTIKNCKFINNDDNEAVLWHDNYYPTEWFGTKNIYQGANFHFIDCSFNNLDIIMHSTEPNRNMPFSLILERCGGINKASFAKIGQATRNYWRGHVISSLIVDDQISNATDQ